MIKSTLARLLLVTAGLLLPQFASAEDELLLYVFQSGQPQRSVTITIDGEIAGSTRLDGSLTADLNAGGHVIAVDAGGEQRVVRFSLESGQLADVVIELAAGNRHWSMFTVVGVCWSGVINPKVVLKLP